MDIVSLGAAHFNSNTKLFNYYCRLTLSVRKFDNLGIDWILENFAQCNKAVKKVPTYVFFAESNKKNFLLYNAFLFLRKFTSKVPLTVNRKLNCPAQRASTLSIIHFSRLHFAF